MISYSDLLNILQAKYQFEEAIIKKWAISTFDLMMSHLNKALTISIEDASVFKLEFSVRISQNLQHEYHICTLR